MSKTGGDSLKEFAKKSSAPRRAVLDLAPLELDCMNILWPVGEGTVRDIRDRLAERRPRAYTTIMTIMDRLARKGIVERRKVGRAYLYRPNLSAEDARSQALVQVIENFFGGSKERLLGHLNGVAAYPAPTPRAFAAAAAAGAAGPTSASSSHVTSQTGTPSDDSEPAERIDDTLL
jgi:BlaI family penicillinase repressor